jgi:hypothetical protein
VSAPGLAELAAAFSHELAEVLTAVSEANTTVEPGSESPTSGVTVTIVVQEGGTGSLHVLVDAEGAALLAKRVLAAEEAVADSDVAEALREVCGQAAAAVVEGFSLKGVRLVATLARLSQRCPSGAASASTDWSRRFAHPRRRHRRLHRRPSRPPTTPGST